ncbi:amino-acid N-acetyltransferase [Crenobacter caeni]|uniref:Amino-acid acetyltransferase n=1 Tax=Crenobacter caeni TaxID=2705474 RepID=A0A6B2KUA8_9NEIS|nr:amino-acid N-acetyltransferase [Crenobacter caeni]NDV13613.1 amino-acid N-acetyltransferase [Crenobacter caeni]
MDTDARFIPLFREAAPYIHAFRTQTFVIAFNGGLVDSPRFALFAQDLSLLAGLGIRIVLIHDAQPQVRAQLATQQLQGGFYGGRCIFGGASMRAFKQGVGGVRAEIEAQLSAGAPHFPMAGAKLRVAGGNYLVASPLGVLDGVDMLGAGCLRRIDDEGIRQRLDAGELVLLSPLGYSPTGESFSLALEDVAAETATALKADKLIFLLDIDDGIRDAQGQLQRAFTPADGGRWLHEQGGHLAEGVRLCMAGALRAVAAGVARAHLIGEACDEALLRELFTRTGSGTAISAAPLVNVRAARDTDLDALVALTAPLIDCGKLVARGRAELARSLEHYFVLEHDGQAAGCVALHPFPADGMAELACLAVGTRWQRRGFGDLLLDHVEHAARDAGLSRLFVLTTQTAQWFVERGFTEASPAALPAAKRAAYNARRRSKVFVRPVAG